MTFRGHLDEAHEFSLHGWAHNDAMPKLSLSVDIVINRRLVCRLPADSYRHDLEAAGFGDGRKAFSFNPFDFLTGDENLVEVYVSGTDQLLYGGRRILPDLSAKEKVIPADPSLKAESRWQGDEDDASLTWGNLMTGDSFFDRVEQHFHFSDEVRVVEIGPGYGRLLRTMMQRNYPFRSFLGLDLSEARITRLRRQFFDSSVQFEVGNCSNFKFDNPFDVGLSSATFEHLFPSIEQALMNFRSNMNSGGMLFIDFIRQDEALAVSKAYFEPDSAGGAYIRIYSRQELDRFFTQAGFVVEAVHPIVLGKGAQGEPINRALVCATAR